MKQNISATVFNPFNHGTSSITYRPVNQSTYDTLSRILLQGWKISNISEILWHDVGPKINSNNFKITVGNKRFLLKISHIKDPELQMLINKCLQFCERNEASTAHLILTSSGSSFLINSDNFFCLYDFVNGDNFDGSQKEFQSAAEHIAKLISVLEFLPYKQEIKRSAQYFYHDTGALCSVVQKALKSRSGTSVDKLIKTYSSEILDSSKDVILIMMKLDSNLPKQVVHGDLHPHNMLFDRKSKELLAFLDFDVLKYTQRVRAVAFAIHRLARTYGIYTEKQNDIGNSIQGRIKLFLDVYCKNALLKDEELKVLKIILQDEALNYIEKILHWHYIEGKTDWSFDLEKRITTLLEAKYFF